VKQKVITQFQYCNLDDLLPYFLDSEKHKLFDCQLDKITIIKKLEMETNILHINMKTQWPVGVRDVLIQQQFVKY
jgi:hypothetical protein